MILNYTKQDDDLKFLCYAADRAFLFVQSDALSLEIGDEKIEDLDLIISRIFQLHGEQATPKGIAEFRRARAAPQPAKGDPSTLTLANYINMVKQMLAAGTLKHKDYIDEFTKRLGFPFDPDFYLLEIRAGRIETIDAVDGMDKLYRESVLAGRQHTICSGLREHYRQEELRDNTYLFVLNIKKIKLRGTESEGMICCTKSGAEVEALQVFGEAGTKICLEGRLELFTELEYGKVDISKNKYKAALESFAIVENRLCFKGTEVLCGGDCVKTKIANGPVS